MSRQLGHVQTIVLKELTRAGHWSQGAGWHWGSADRTKKVLDSLVRRGLVNVVDGVYTPALTNVKCRWCVRGNVDAWGECERCGYTGNCSNCGGTVEADGEWPDACSHQCRDELAAQYEADRLEP